MRRERSGSQAAPRRPIGKRGRMDAIRLVTGANTAGPIGGSFVRDGDDSFPAHEPMDGNGRGARHSVSRRDAGKRRDQGLRAIYAWIAARIFANPRHSATIRLSPPGVGVTS